MHLLVDSDSLCYAAGFVANEEGQESLACYQASETIKRTLQETQCDSYQLYLSGSNNFRYKIYPEYKANRVDMKRPIHLQAIREHLVSEWGATVTDGIEADDAVGIAQSCGEGDTAISHIDKDIDMIVGRHWNPVKKIWYDISNEQAFQNFYIQLILGDKTDNIPGFDGKMRPKAPKFLYPVLEEIQFAMSCEELLQIVSDKWNCQYYEEGVDTVRWHEFNQAAHCLWIQRKEYDDWRNYLNDNTMEELGLPVGLIRSLPAPFEQPAEDGLPSMSA